MKRNVICPICNETLASAHANEALLFKVAHTKWAHPKEAQRLGELHEALEKIREEARAIGFNTDSILYFRKKAA